MPALERGKNGVSHLRNAGDGGDVGFVGSGIGGVHPVSRSGVFSGDGRVEMKPGREFRPHGGDRSRNVSNRGDVIEMGAGGGGERKCGRGERRVVG